MVITLNEFMTRLKNKTGFERTVEEAIRDKVCYQCGAVHPILTTPQTRREYTISGLCQQCQNKAFNPKKKHPTKKAPKKKEAQKNNAQCTIV